MVKKIKREVIEWVVLIGVVLTLYFTGLHTEVIGMIQRVVLAPGLIKPEVIPASEQQDASYQFNLVDVDGNTVSFEKFRGKTIFINLWATWCPPCVAEMPDINSLYGKIDSDEIAFVMISRDQDFDKAIQFAAKKAYDFPIYSEASLLPSVFQTNSIPTTFVISPQGKIVVKKSGMASYDSEEFRDFLNGL
ncbi:TlpA disulfide reductase family protein [Reichenbachiella sp. MALMAid0571]|uniref:TlpA family protein disulfide reductase n=1 Tax=Reichenbachiella sp. MALMAid0571 TaxID=3143939 RepID=UPI0032DEC3EC